MLFSNEEISKNSIHNLGHFGVPETFQGLNETISPSRIAEKISS